jgi:hypothetical protein
MKLEKSLKKIRVASAKSSDKGSNPGRHSFLGGTALQTNYRAQWHRQKAHRSQFVLPLGSHYRVLRKNCVQNRNSCHWEYGPKPDAEHPHTGKN